MEQRLKALSVKQPWAYMIVTGQKTLEVRKRSLKHRGLLVIHASRTIDEVARQYFGFESVELPTGAALGTVCVAAEEQLSGSEMLRRRWEHRCWGPFLHGSVCLQLTSPTIFQTPTQMLGQLRVFLVPEEAELQIRLQLKTTV